MNGGLLQLALRELQGVLTSRVSRIALVLTVVVLTASGPFGTYERFGLGQRLLYWGAMVLGCYLTGTAAGNVLNAVLHPLIAQRWPRVLVAGFLTGLPVTVVVLAVNTVASQSFVAAALLPIWINATLVTMVVFTALVLLGDRLQAAAGRAPGAPIPAAAVPAPAQTTPVEATPLILARVPLPQRGRLLALVVEDHYVDIVTDRGKALVLMRLADAMRETGGVAGLQIHRSHWVARDAVVKAHRSDGKLLLELSNGLRLPVSRGFLPQVRDAGLG